MITKKLKVGDHIYDASGRLGRITKVNKQSYSFVVLTGLSGGTSNIPFDGIRNSSWANEEWFYCEDAAAMSLKQAFERYVEGRELIEKIRRAEELLGKAKFFLSQIEDINEVTVKEDDFGDYDDWEF